ncbi:nuclear transport factor 2 family protein [Nonomuraea africana]|uniref:SnoaL-like domain-containing protein n=1 Tax=Nonomuraea africana TaxID=46171 RepID=A0ABR9KM91_9ACTN|nr:nuclear transport factor 2 family protein [Nonomuraea africana]MBE1563120.1 hypothetical protein [Nonomuraea africana]
MKRGTALLIGGVAVLVIGGGVALAVANGPDAAAGQALPQPATTTAAASTQATAETSGEKITVDPAAQRYVDAVAKEDLDALVASFAPDAVIVDVGREIRGHDAIRHWADTEVIGGRLTVLGTTPRQGGTTMLVRFAPGGTGGFRASYSFDISGGLITKATLEYA